MSRRILATDLHAPQSKTEFFKTKDFTPSYSTSSQDLLYSSPLYHDPEHILFLVNCPYPCKHCSQVPDAWLRPAEVVGRPKLFMMPTRELFSVRSSISVSVNFARVTTPPGSVLGLGSVLLRDCTPQTSGIAPTVPGVLPLLGQADSLSCSRTIDTVWSESKSIPDHTHFQHSKKKHPDR